MFTLASSFTPRGQAAKSSAAFLVRIQAFCGEVALTFSLLRAEGDPGWHARCQPRMFPDLFVFSPFCVITRTLSDSPKLERQVSELVSSINGEYDSLDFIPVHH